MRQRARTDLCGGRSAMVVPTATWSSFPDIARQAVLRNSDPEAVDISEEIFFEVCDCVAWEPGRIVIFSTKPGQTMALRGNLWASAVA